MSDTTEEVKVEAAEEAVEVPAKFKKFVDEIEKLTVVELNELVKVFEKKFGVSASAVAAAGPAAGPRRTSIFFTVAQSTSYKSGAKPDGSFTGIPSTITPIPLSPRSVSIPCPRMDT